MTSAPSSSTSVTIACSSSSVRSCTSSPCRRSSPRGPSATRRRSLLLVQELQGWFLLEFNKVGWFSFDPEFHVEREQMCCYLTQTTKETHQIVTDNLDETPTYGGWVEAKGPRYCPSIEDKIVRFKDKESHQIFLEPEGRNVPELYLQGFSTRLPERLLLSLVRTIPGLENCLMLRPAYAVEYDTYLHISAQGHLRQRSEGLFFSGQINGTTGYEEAAAQGIISGINAARHSDGKSLIILERESSYIGTLIDDLVTKDLREPYRMLTRQQTSLLFGQAPYGQMGSCASSSWDNPGGAFKFAETKAPWLKPAGAAGVDGLHLSSQQVWNNIMPHGTHQDFDGFMAFKGTSAKVPNQVCITLSPIHPCPGSDAIACLHPRPEVHLTSPETLEPPSSPTTVVCRSRRHQQQRASISSNARPLSVVAITHNCSRRIRGNHF